MAKFKSSSRYVKYSFSYRSVDIGGRETLAVAPASATNQTVLGDHLLNDNERLDHLANFYLSDPTGFWRILDVNDTILPDAVYAIGTVKIPKKG